MLQNSNVPSAIPLFCSAHESKALLFDSACKRLDKLQHQRIAILDPSKPAEWNERNPNGGLRFVSPAYRGCEGYAFRLHWRFKDSMERLRRLRGFLTLTIDPKPFCCRFSAYQAVSTIFNNFHTKAKKLKLFNQYLWTLEPQHTWNPHLHMLIDRDYLTNEELMQFKKIWPYGMLFYRYLPSVDSEDKQIHSYVTKYMRKYASGPNLHWYAFLKAGRFRQWSCSRGLISPYHSSSKSLLVGFSNDSSLSGVSINETIFAEQDDYSIGSLVSVCDKWRLVILPILQIDYIADEYLEPYGEIENGSPSKSLLPHCD